MVTPHLITDQYEKKCQLSSICGDKGSIWVAKHSLTGNHVALKIYDLEKCEEEFKRIQSEVVTVKQLSHPNILNHFSSFTSDHELHIVMPLIGYTSAARIVASHFCDGLDEPALALITRDVLTGIKYLHSKGIIHRAIRGSHILIESNGRCVLSGLRHSAWCYEDGRRIKRIHSYPDEAPFNLNWESPEILKQDTEGYSVKTDIYSLGITLCELGNGEVPYCRLEPQLMLVEKIYGKEPFLFDINTCEPCEPEENGKDSGVGGSYGDCLSSLPKATEKEFSSSAHQLVTACLNVQSACRPSADKLLHHPFIRQTKKITGTLTNILLPVTPIDEETDFGPFDTDIGLLEKPMDEFSLDDIEWDL